MPDAEDSKHGAVEELDIRFESNPAVYREGDSVTGILHINTTEDVLYEAIQIELLGFAVVRWNIPETDSEELVDPENLKGDYNKEEYFHKKIILSEKEGSEPELLAAGQVDLPFEFKLPPELPSSFEGQYGQVRYLAKGSIKRKSKSNVVTKKAFTVLSGLDLNFIPEAACKIEICKYKQIGNCCTSGSVVIDWTVCRSGYVPGENVWINGAVQNESKAIVAYSKATLFMVIEYKTKRGRRKERRKIAMADKGETLSGDVTVWHESIHIPPLPPTGIGRSIIIDINYELEFKALIEGYPTPISFTKELYIGTVPMSRKEMKSCIAGMFNQPYRESVETLDVKSSTTSQASITKILAAASATEPKTQPTAPTLAALERAASCGGTLEGLLDKDDLKEDNNTPQEEPGAESNETTDENNATSPRPPPFAPGYNTVDMDPNHASPTAPTANTLMRPWPEHIILSDPTFESSAMFGPVSLREPTDDDSESLRGEFIYHPVYTYFGTLPPGARPLSTP